MLEAIPKSIFSTTFRLHQQNQLLGEFDTSIWRDRAQLELEDGSYQLYRLGHFSGDFILEHDGQVVARASKPSAFQCTFEVELPNRRLVLRKGSSWNRRFELFEGEKKVGSIYPLGVFTSRTSIDLPDDWPLPIRVFLFWLAFLIWKRQQAAAS